MLLQHFLHSRSTLLAWRVFHMQNNFTTHMRSESTGIIISPYVLQQTHGTADRPVGRNPPPNLQPRLSSLLV